MYIVMTEPMLKQQFSIISIISTHLWTQTDLGFILRVHDVPANCVLLRWALKNGLMLSTKPIQANYGD